jgi:glutamine synthetase
MQRAIPKFLKEPKINFNGLDQMGKVIVEYVWIGGTGQDIRSKARTLDKEVKSIDELEEWNYDGSSTHQATTESSEILIRPVAMFDDPFRGKPNKIVLCETFRTDGTPTNTNFRYFARQIFDMDKENKFDPMFGVEQEYALMESIGTGLSWPYGWPKGGFPQPQGKYYCSVGSKCNKGREVMNFHYKMCLAAGVKVFGTNAETMPGQWEFQVGTCSGLEAGDHLWMARYLLYRTGEVYQVDINFDPKPISGDWAGSGCHTNFSTKQTREDTELKQILLDMEILRKNHERMLSFYGENNERRLTGKNETQSITKFDYGIASRGASIRIPLGTKLAGKGYYEDRRPAANMDPYVVTSVLFSFICQGGKGVDEMEKHYQSFIAFKKDNNIK